MNRYSIWVAAIFASAIGAQSTTSVGATSPSERTSARPAYLAMEAMMPSLDRATAWINADPLSATKLRGHVVVIDFWTYSCINWRRTLPYLLALQRKYQDHGLVIVGVHTPEFGFEKDIDNVRRNAAALNIDYPIAVDSESAIWRAFDNHYWPALYLIDAQGRIRHQVFGEGNYDQADTILEQLLTEAGQGLAGVAPVTIEAHGAEAGADWRNLKSPETYVGYARTERFASSGRVSFDRARKYAAPATLRLNEWALSGNWTMKQESATLNTPGGRITYRFHARDLHLVM
jgi:thiol-disulfide isomerase/thioredoxin